MSERHANAYRRSAAGSVLATATERRAFGTGAHFDLLTRGCPCGNYYRTAM